MFYVFETVEGRVFVATEDRLEKVKAELAELNENYDLYLANDIQVRGDDLDVKYYGKQKSID